MIIGLATLKNSRFSLSARHSKEVELIDTARLTDGDLTPIKGFLSTNS